MLLQSLFKGRRPSSGRRRRSFRPSLNSLEGRQLMSGDVITTINGPNVVGSHFRITATDKNYQIYTPGTVASTTWTIQGAYASPQTNGKTPDGATPINPTFGPTEDGGYQYTALYKITVPGDTIDGFWNGNPGSHVVNTTINFTPESGRPQETKSATMDVVAPTGEIHEVFTNGLKVAYDIFGIPRLDTNGRDPSKPGIVLGFSVDPNSPGASGGKYGVVQTVDMRIYRQYNAWNQEAGVWEPVTTLVPSKKNDDGTVEHIPFLLDNTPDEDTADGQFTPYFGTYDDQPKLTWDVGGPNGEIEDTPRAMMSSTDTRTIQRMVDTNIFTDTLMFTPPGGIAVPLGYLKWSYVGDVNRSPVDNALYVGWGTSINPHISTVYTTSSVIPAWDDTVENQAAHGKGIPIQGGIPSNATDLTFVVPPPIFTAATNDDWTSDGGADWSSWTRDGGASWTIPFVQYNDFTSYDYTQLVTPPTGDSATTAALVQDQPTTSTLTTTGTDPYNTPPSNLSLIPVWSNSTTTTENPYYLQTPPAGKTKLVPLTDLPAGTEWWYMDSITAYDPAQDTDLIFVWQ